MTPAEAQTFLIVFAAVGLLSLGGYVLARKLSEDRDGNTAIGDERTGRVALIAAAATGLILTFAIALIAVLVGRQSG